MILHFAFRYGVSATGEYFEPEGAVAFTPAEQVQAWAVPPRSRGRYLLFVRGQGAPVRDYLTINSIPSEEPIGMWEPSYPLAGVLSRSPSLVWSPMHFRSFVGMRVAFRVYGGSAAKGIGGGRGPRAILGTFLRQLREGAGLVVSKRSLQPRHLSDGVDHYCINGTTPGGFPVGTVSWLRSHERVDASAPMPMPPLLDTRTVLEAGLRARMAASMVQEVDRAFMAAGRGSGYVQENAASTRYYVPGFTGPPLPSQGGTPPPPRDDLSLLDDGKRRIRRRSRGR